MANALFTPKVLPHSCISRNHKRAHKEETQPSAQRCCAGRSVREKIPVRERIIKTPAGIQRIDRVAPVILTGG